MYGTRTTCRVCGSADLTYLFSLGDQYVSDFVDEDKVNSGLKVPIELEQCQNCTLVQQKHSAPPELLYRRYYWYRSGVTETMRVALLDIVEAAKELVELKEFDVVLDIGANDGTLLSYWDADKLFRVGVEPAENLQKELKKRCNYVVEEFWGNEIALRNYKRHFVDRAAKVITAIGMFYDLEDSNQFIADIATVLHKNGVFISQLMCAYDMIRLRDVGNLAHEHLEFYTITSLQRLFEAHNLEIFRIERNSVNGGSYRIFAGHLGRWSVDKSVKALSNVEVAVGINQPEAYQKFFEGVERNKDECVGFIRDKVKKGAEVFVYGASTKGNVILQYYGLDARVIKGASDKSPEKWGKYTVGTGIKIMGEGAARHLNPDYFLVLPYAFLDEFIERERNWRSRGGHFIVPLPTFRVI